MPTTPQEKAAKWPWAFYTDPVGNVWPHRIQIDAEEEPTYVELGGLFPTLAAAIAAIAKTQE